MLKGQGTLQAVGSQSPLSDCQERWWKEDELCAISPSASSAAGSVFTNHLICISGHCLIYFRGQP